MSSQGRQRRTPHSESARSQRSTRVGASAFVLVCAFVVGAGCHVESLDFTPWESFDEMQGIRDGGDVVAAREEMIDLVFGGPLPTRMPDGVELTTDSAFPGRLIQEVTIETDDLTSVAYLIHPSTWNGTLAIYHQGHTGDFRDYGTNTIEGLLDSRYQVLAFSMPMIGLNTHPFDTSEHSELQVREHPLRYFIEPVIVALNWAESRYGYARRFMVGISGGGWTTVVVAGIDPRIDASYPVAGTWPHYLRDRFGFYGDYEERITPNYLELYLMATYPGREQVQMFNEFDPCCFNGLVAYDYLSYVSYRANAWGGRFDILMDHGHTEHTISEYSLGQILDLERIGPG